LKLLICIISFIICFPISVFSESCHLSETQIVLNEIKCFYKCESNKKYFMFNKDEQCPFEINLVKKNSNLNKKTIFPKLYFGFSSSSGSSIGIDLEINN